jgi:hypothetical protein
MPSVSRNPGEHRVEELDSNRFTQQSQNFLRVFQHIARVDLGRSRSDIGAHPIEYLRLLDEADVFELRIVISFDIGNDDLRRIANEEAVGHRTEPAPVDLKQEMMGHLLLVENAFPGRDRAR